MIDMLEDILRRPRTVLTMMVVLVAAGIVSYLTIPKEANPDIDVPVFYVSVVQPGVSPEDAERLLVRPMETQLRGLDGLKEITAVASEGHAGIVLEFNIDFDKDAALADVRDRVDRAQAELPAEAEQAQIFETNFSLVPTIVVALSGEVPERTLFQLAQHLQDVIETIPTVLEAKLSGHREELLEVIIDNAALESYGITQQELLTSLTSNNQLVPAGTLDTGSGRFNLKVPGLIETALDVYALPIRENNDGVVTLGDVAEVRRTFKDAVTYTRVNGQPTIAVSVTKRIGTNIIENNAAVRAAVEEAIRDWPDNVRVDFMLDQSSFINEVLGSLQSSIMTAIALVMVVVLASLGLRSSLLVGMAIPTSFMVGFLILNLSGLTVNMMVMFGLVLTVGMLVDGAIVMVEYADRKIDEGLDPNEAYIRAARLMFWPIVSSTATTLVAFLPMLLWPGVPGEFMSYLPIMVVIVLTAALVTAMIFLPVTGAVVGRISAWAGRRAGYLYQAMLGLAGFVLVNALVSSVLPGFLGFLAGLAAAGGLAYLTAKPFAALNERLHLAHDRVAAEKAHEAAKLSVKGHFDVASIRGVNGLYVRTLKRLVTTPLGNVIAIGTVLGICVIAVIVFSANNAGVEFFVDEEPDVAVVLISARGNLSASETRDLVVEVENRILDVEGIRSMLVSSTPSGASNGGGGGVGEVRDKPADLIGEIQLEMADFCCRSSAAEIFDDIRARTADLAGIRIEIREIEGGPPTGKDLRLEVRGSDYNQILAVTRQVRQYVDTMTSVRDVEDDTPLPGIEWQIIIDREEAGRFGAAIASVGPMMQLVTNGVLIDRYRPDDSDDEVEIRVRLPEDERSLERLDALRITTSEGQIPLSNFIARHAEQRVSAITRKDGQYVMTVKANAAEGLLPVAIVSELQTWLDAQEWPEGVFFRFRGADEEQKESGEFLMKAMLGSLFLMFIILVTQYNSFYQTFITLGTVVLSVFGVLLGMGLTGQSFSIIMSGTGVVALAGIVVNNAIVLIDTYNRFCEEGMETFEAILKTAAQRIRPIMLTTITTIAGLIPMATQVNFDFFARVVTVGSITSMWWVQLSTAVISGLAFSTLLTLVVVPVMLAIPTVWAGAFGRLHQWGRKHPRYAALMDRFHEPHEGETAHAGGENAPNGETNVTLFERKKTLSDLPHAAE